MATKTQQFMTNLRNEVYKLIVKIRNKLEHNDSDSALKIKQRLIEIENYLDSYKHDISYMAASRDWLEKVVDAIDTY
jgi:hypothetical protein